jgi:hypothetical protein
MAFRETTRGGGDGGGSGGRQLRLGGDLGLWEELATGECVSSERRGGGCGAVRGDGDVRKKGSVRHTHRHRRDEKREAGVAVDPVAGPRYGPDGAEAGAAVRARASGAATDCAEEEEKAVCRGREQRMAKGGAADGVGRSGLGFALGRMEEMMPVGRSQVGDRVSAADVGGGGS